MALDDPTDIENIIIDIFTEFNCLKGTQLISHVIDRIIDNKRKVRALNDIEQIIPQIIPLTNKLVREGKLREVEYVVPQSLYFSAETQIKIVGE